MTQQNGAKRFLSSSAEFLSSLAPGRGSREENGAGSVKAHPIVDSGDAETDASVLVDQSFPSNCSDNIDISSLRSELTLGVRGEDRLCSSSLGKLSLDDWEDGSEDEYDAYDEDEDSDDAKKEGRDKSQLMSPGRRKSSSSIEALADSNLREAMHASQRGRSSSVNSVNSVKSQDNGVGGLGLGAKMATDPATGGGAGVGGGKPVARVLQEDVDKLPIAQSPVIAIPHSPDVKNPKQFTHAPPRGLGGAGRALAAAYQASESIPYKRAVIPEPSLTTHDKNFCKALVSMLEKRKNYLYKIHTVVSTKSWDPKELEKEGKHGDYIEASPMSFTPFKVDPKEDSHLEFKMENGVYIPTNENHSIAIPVSASVFYADLHDLSSMMNSAPYHTFAHRRLKLLQEKFSLYQMLNAEKEFLAIKALCHRDFYNVRKVDNHVHHSACMNQKHLLRFIKKRVREEGDQPVIERDGKVLSLNDVFESLGLSPYDLNIDVLDMHAHNTKNTTFYRFDKFNQKFNPTGEARLREIFLKTNNYVGGKFLAGITQEVFEDLAQSKYQMAEYRLSIYGKSKTEWSQLASWWYDHKLVSPNVVWMIQIPRLYEIYRKNGMLSNFGEFISNIFEPLFEITRQPNKDPKLVAFLDNVVGFDIVDDESQHERKVSRVMPSPEDWDAEKNPAYNYYMYYIYANLYVLNSFRQQRNMSQFSFRPHSGEAGDVDHLAGAFLVANSINHGINLKKSPSLQYLYYLAQVGLAMSPLSNNCLFCEYSKNPFPTFFERGLNVTLSTDDPLLIHMTKEPLVEEYSIAMQVYKLSTADLSEIARNSVLQSGFPKELKRHWVGGSKMFENNPYQSNVPDVRIQFRKEALDAELEMVYKWGMANFEA